MKVSLLAALVGDWRAFLSDGIAAQEAEAMRRHERTGRPLGSARFVADPEKVLGRRLARQRPGREPMARPK